MQDPKVGLPQPNEKQYGILLQIAMQAQVMKYKLAQTFYLER